MVERVAYHTGYDEEQDCGPVQPKVPRGVLFTCSGSTQQELLFMHPNSHKLIDEAYVEGEDELIDDVENNKKGPQRIAFRRKNLSATVRTQYGYSTDLLASLLCVKEKLLNVPFELKLGAVVFVGFPCALTPCPYRQTESHSLDSVHVIFSLPAHVSHQVVERFQNLSKKLAYAIDSLQTIDNYLYKQHRLMHQTIEEWRKNPGRGDTLPPWDKVRTKSKLAALFAQIYDDIHRTGVVQVFMDNFIEVGFCMETRALEHAHLTPRPRDEIERLVRKIRPYHGVLLLEDVTPTPDANPSVALMLKHCDPDRSILDISTASGVPLMQVLLVVRHLLTWARAIVIFPVVNTNVYSSATEYKDFTKEAKRFEEFFGHVANLTETLSAFDPPKPLHHYVNPALPLAVQQVRTRIVIYLLRHQQIMQLHMFAYLLPPCSTDKNLPTNRYCPQGLKDIINKVPTFVPLWERHQEEDSNATNTSFRIEEIDDDGNVITSPTKHLETDNEDSNSEEDSAISYVGGIPAPIKRLLMRLCGHWLETNSYGEVERRLTMFCKLAPLLDGNHHVEDLMYRLNWRRADVVELFDHFHTVVTSFMRPDFISCTADSLR